jgi:hypothetical protein
MTGDGIDIRRMTMKKKILRFGLGLALVLGLVAVLPQNVAAQSCAQVPKLTCPYGTGSYTCSDLVYYTSGTCYVMPTIWVYQNWQWSCSVHPYYFCFQEVNGPYRCVTVYPIYPDSNVATNAGTTVLTDSSWMSTYCPAR